MGVLSDGAWYPKVTRGERRSRIMQENDEVYPFPYGVWNPVGTEGRGGGRLGQGESDFVYGEGDGPGVLGEMTPRG